MKNILNLIRDLRAGKLGYHTESKYIESVVYYTKVSMWQLNYILDIILDSKYVWNGEELPEKGSMIVTQEEGKILQGALMMLGHYWLDFEWGPIPFKCRLHHHSELETYNLHWHYDHVLSWYDNMNTHPYIDFFCFSEFEENGAFTLPDKYQGWRTGENYGI